MQIKIRWACTKNIWKYLYKNYIINRISCRVPGYLEMASCCLENWRQLPVALKGGENFLLPWDGSFFWRRNAPAKPRVGYLKFFWLGCKPLGRALENLAIAWVEHRELEVCLVTTKRSFSDNFRYAGGKARGSMTPYLVVCWLPDLV